ncbi:cytochrome c [Emcibacter sp. SYSU 3D8]|uniref:cytochrome c n=1 Tax=Emcibacter sp. SYSU 3D8 TaxID=3133969 RepID=UPI0031FE5140
MSVLIWSKFFRSEEQLFAADPETGASAELQRFQYGTMGGDLIAGIPYPVMFILPRVFPDLIGAAGGYGAFGLSWEPGQRLPIGFSIKRKGYERVTVNCALCHTAQYRLTPGENPRFAAGGPGHTVRLQALLRFLFACAHDERFTGDRMLPELALHFPMDAADLALYKLVIIPATRAALLEAEKQLAWMETRPDWGPGRDDAFNLPKFVLTLADEDGTVGTTDFPSLWKLGQRKGTLYHAGGEAGALSTVVATSALGSGALPGPDFNRRNDWTEAFIQDLSPPPFPGQTDAVSVQEGRSLFGQHCASCHAPGGARTGTSIPLAEIGTDPEHVKTWQEDDARRMKRVSAVLGVKEAPMLASTGYVAKPLVGVWLLGPYLHNGSVPTLVDLLAPPAQRPRVFWRGYDVVDLENVGFVSSGPDAEKAGFRYDTGLRGNGNGGHLWGTDLPPGQKRALIDYLKGL